MRPREVKKFSDELQLVSKWQSSDLDLGSLYCALLSDANLSIMPLRK